jgi:zinc transport system permease protein
MKDIRVDVLGFLYGDILAMAWSDVIMIFVGGALVFGILAWLWQPLLRISVDSDLAQVEGVRVQNVQAGYVVLLAIVIAIAIKIVGVLLITALLVIPAAAARPCASSPERMAILASIIGMISVIVGILSSHIWDVPTGPAIVVTAAVILLMTTSLFNYKRSD